MFNSQICQQVFDQFWGPVRKDLLKETDLGVSGRSRYIIFDQVRITIHNQVRRQVGLQLAVDIGELYD